MIKLTVFDTKGRVVWVNTKLVCFLTRMEGKTIISFGYEHSDLWVEETLEEISDKWTELA